MKHIPILFSTEMVQAILDGRKTQTRREIKQAIGYDPIWKPTLIKEEHLDGIPRYEMRTGTQYSLPWFKCPYGQPGDVLWVRESFQKRTDRALELGFDRYYYKAGWEGCTDGGWKPSIHMPKAACRIWLQVVSVKVERLDAISEDDAIAEGIIDEKGKCKNYTSTNEADWYGDSRASFYSLWESINGFQSIIDNPWVWRIEFKRIDKPENFI